jgi:hypothetical protein
MELTNIVNVFWQIYLPHLSTNSWAYEKGVALSPESFTTLTSHAGGPPLKRPYAWQAACGCLLINSN